MGQENITFVLVHGAWHGGWCWKKVIPFLKSSGYEVFTPTLTGLGERSHLLNRHIDLDTHIKDISSVLEYEDLKDVVLVGHSYAGMVITGVAERSGMRLAHLVYLDAVIPENEKSFKDYLPGFPLDEIVQSIGDGWRMPPQIKFEDYGVTESSDINWMSSRLNDQPYKTLSQPLRLSAIPDKTLKKTYVQLSESPWSKDIFNRTEKEGMDFYKLLSAGHEAMITNPKAIADILLDLVKSET